MRYYLGVDGGGTKTAFCAVGEDGSKQKWVGRPMNYRTQDKETVLRSFLEDIGALRIPPEEIVSLAIGDPSIDDVPDSPEACAFQAALKESFPHAVLTIRSDTYMALYGVCGDKDDGAIVISGTGSMAMARIRGEIRICGGWGRVTADEGSAFFIATEGIRSALHDADGMGPKTSLRPSLLSAYSCKTPRELISRFYRPDTDIASFAQTVHACARKGDAESLRILKEAAGLLARQVSALFSAKTVKVPIGIYGSVLTRNEIVRSEFRRQIREYLPNARVVLPAWSPEEAAVALAEQRYRDAAGLHP